MRERVGKTGQTLRLIALHGFLGCPGDWDALRPFVPWAQVEALDLWAWLEETGAWGWEAVGRALNRQLGEPAGRPGDGAGPPPPLVLLAYSFGARLALASAALTSGGTRAGAACLVSCHPGLPEGDATAREARAEADERWARLLLEAPEDVIWRAWNAQPVLAAPGREAVPAARAGALPARRSTLARAMRAFTLAGQPDRRPDLQHTAVPLLWVTGEADGKFGALADGLARGGVPATFASCPGAGHRVPWDNPEAFARILAGWLGSVGLLEARHHVDDDQDV